MNAQTEWFFSVKRFLLYKYRYILSFFHIHDLCVYIFKFLRKIQKKNKLLPNILYVEFQKVEVKMTFNQLITWHNVWI